MFPANKKLKSVMNMIFHLFLTLIFSDQGSTVRMDIKQLSTPDYLFRSSSMKFFLVILIILKFHPLPGWQLLYSPLWIIFL